MSLIPSLFPILLLLSLGVLSTNYETPAYRVVHLEDLFDNPSWKSENKRWSAPKSGRITRVAAHLGSNSVLVGMNNSVIRLSADRLEKLDEVSWSLPREQYAQCGNKHVNDLVDCNSYTVSLLLPVNGIFSTLALKIFRTGVFACITNGRTSECSLRQIADLRGPPKIHWKGPRSCPIDPRSLVSVTYASNQNLYVAGWFQEDGISVPTITRISESRSEGNLASTVQYARFPTRNKWIFQDERTEFVHSFEFHDAVYFVFREPSEELIEGCKKITIVSRIGRLCLVDDTSRSGRLQTFVKATIACPGSNDAQTQSYFIHPLIQSVHLDQSSKTFFAAFTTSSAMPASSVLCEYRLTEIEKVFEGPFHLFRSEHTKYDNPIRCLNTDSTENMGVDLPLNSRLMHNVIRPRTGQPILMKEGIIWKHVSVDWVPQTPKSDNNLIAFTMDSEDVLTKWHLFKSEACVIEQIHIHRDPELEHPRDNTVHMQLIRNDSKPVLLISTTKSVYCLPVARCSRLGNSEHACELLHDPYCAWNRQTQQCQQVVDAQEPEKQLIRYETCPSGIQKLSNLIVDGHWGAWGPWSTCKMNSDRSIHARWIVDSASRAVMRKWDVGEPLMVNDCQCRYRYCSSPYRHGAGSKACPGEEAVQLANCSLDGMWTAWSSWSGCEPSCKSPGRGDRLTGPVLNELSTNEDSNPLRTRQRWCSSPSPMGDLGRRCTGVGKESRSCAKLDIRCPVNPISLFTWSAWSEWNTCSAVCNGGVQLRWRKCGPIDDIKHFQPAALKTSMITDLLKQDFPNKCLGEAYESRTCNTHNCPITKVTSSWTSWYITDGDPQKGTQERRYRVECVAAVPGADKLHASVQIQNANCRMDITGSVVCQDITNPKKTTESIKLEKPIQPSGGWSSWTRCSRPCGGGVRNRWHLTGSSSGSKILSDSKPLDLGNDGADTEEEVCNSHPCPGRWSCWTAWSKCTHPPCSIQRGEQRRFRTCLVSSSLRLTNGQEPTVDQCDGGEDQSVQSRPCEVTFKDLQCQPNKIDTRKRTIPEEQESQMDPLDLGSKTSTPWADWSECFPLETVSYEVRIRAREHCKGCELVQAERCDTHDIVSIDGIIQRAPQLRGAKSAGQDMKEHREYGTGHALAAGIFGALLGIAVVLIPYCIYFREKKRGQTTTDRKRKIFSGLRKKDEKKLQQERNMPYIWFADADRPEKAAVKQLLVQRKRANSPGVRVSPPTARKRGEKFRVTENPADSPSTMRTHSSVARADPYRNASLTRIQALHNDHRNVLKKRNVSPLSADESNVQWEPISVDKTGMNPGFVDFSPTQCHYVPSNMHHPNAASTYDSNLNSVVITKKCGSANTQGREMNSPSMKNEETIYASA